MRRVWQDLRPAGFGAKLTEPFVAVPLLVLIALALRVPNLGESLWNDEVIYSTHYQIHSWYGLWRFLMENPPAPLYPILTFVWVAVVGDHELLVRLPSLVFGLGSIVLTYHIARGAGSNSLAFLAGLVLCLSPAHVWYSQEATPYAMAMCLLLAAVYTWSRLKTTPFDASRYAMYLVLLLASVFTHYFVIVFLGPLSLAVPKQLRMRLFLAHAVVALCFVAALGIKYLGGSLASPGGFLRPFTIFEWWMLFFNWFLHGNSLWTISPYRATTDYLLGHPLLLAMQVLCALVLVRGLWPSREKQGGLLEQSELALLLCALPMALLLPTAAGYHQLYIERYVIVALPFFAVALARGVARFSTAWVRNVLVCALVAIGVGSYAMLLVKGTRWTVYKQNPDFRSAARAVRTARLEGAWPSRRYLWNSRTTWTKRGPAHLESAAPSARLTSRTCLPRHRYEQSSWRTCKRGQTSARFSGGSRRITVCT